MRRGRSIINSKSFASRGVVALLFGIAVLLIPAAGLFALVIAVGAYAFVDGFFALMGAMAPHQRSSRLWLTLEGVIGIALGATIFSVPQIAATALVYLIGAWAIFTGAFKIGAAIRARKEIRGEGLIMLSGAGSVDVSARATLATTEATSGNRISVAF